MSGNYHSTRSKGGLTATAYRGDGSALIAFDLDEHLTPDLAGFSIQVQHPSGGSEYLLNRLSFETTLSSESTPKDRQAAWTPSDQAPFQRFRWQHFPPQLEAGVYQYTVTAMYFTGTANDIQTGLSVTVPIELLPLDFGRMKIGFTRSFVSSQAYVQRFHNEDLRPGKTLDYDPAPYQEPYAFLGYSARKLIYDFLDECVGDESITVDAFVYDIDEVQIVEKLKLLGKRLRIFADNADLHTCEGVVKARNRALKNEKKPPLSASDAAALEKTVLEPQVQQRIAAAGGEVKTGHFSRFAHCKVFIQRKDGKPVKVLTGSANFSVRGLYVQANNVLVFDDGPTAQLYGDVFDAVWIDPSTAAFAKSPLSSKWYDHLASENLPVYDVAFSPHADAGLSLTPVANAVRNAKSSVLFAVMELGGSGPVLKQLQRLASESSIFSYGITQNVSVGRTRTDGTADEETTGVSVFGPDAGGKHGVLIPFDFLSKNVPEPFDKEVRGGPGQVIHNKFVIVDFNGSEPVLYTGSSNLAEGGEESNGDNLIAIHDRAVATMYGVEAIRLVDHFRFRAALHGATGMKTLQLEGPKGGAKGRKWWEPYYVKNSERYTERLLFIK
jgi:phosphatidylserine/phosphatidylglycerophosphate/cardiolipin synthase-like enzyme